MTPSPFFTDSELTQPCLRISAESQDRAASLALSNASRRWSAYLNAIGLDSVLQWLRQDYPDAASWLPMAHYPALWEVVDGSAITLSAQRLQARLIVLPSAAIDTSELRVPQEWVDSPSWAGDYYLAVQVEPDEEWVRIWGFTTHAQLKQSGEYDESDRTYSLAADQLIANLDVLLEAIDLNLQPMRAAIAPLPAIPVPQADQLIARLGNPEVMLPRLAIPFSLWTALLEHGGWRQQLYQHRLGLPEQWSVLQWLSNGVSQLAQQFGWEQVVFQPGWTGARSAASAAAPSPILARPLVIAGQAYELRLIPQGDSQQRIWQFELRRSAGASADPQASLIPRGVKLRLLTEDCQPFENNEATASRPVERLYVVVALEANEGVVWEIEPTPENYEREILRF